MIASKYLKIGPVNLESKIYIRLDPINRTVVETYSSLDKSCHSWFFVSRQEFSKWDIWSQVKHLIDTILILCARYNTVSRGGGPWPHLNYGFLSQCNWAYVSCISTCALNSLASNGLLLGRIHYYLNQIWPPKSLQHIIRVP